MAFISSGYNPDKPMENRITDIGPQKYDLFYPPVIAKNKANGCITKSSNPACWCMWPKAATNATPCASVVPA